MILRLLGSAALILVVACGGPSVKNPDKTLVLHSSMYNVANVTSFASFIEGDPGNDKPLDVSRIEKKEFNALLEQHPTVRVTSGWNMDDREVVYESVNVEKWSQLTDMRKSFEKANDKFQKFMTNSKTQLSLD